MTLVLYMLRRFFSIFLGALFFFVIVLCLTDLFMNLWNYISKGVATSEIALIMLYYVPKTVWYAVPIATLFATAYMLSDFYAKNELVIIFASGVSLLKFTAPLLLVSVFMSIGLFVFEDRLVVSTYSRKVRLQEAALQKEKSLNNDNIMILAEEGRLIYKADFFENSTGRLNIFYAVFRDDSHNLLAMVYAPAAEWMEDRWVLSGGVEYRFDAEGNVEKCAVEEQYLERLVEPAETFRNNTVSIEEVAADEARAYITHLEKAGLPFHEEKSIYYKKFSFPSVVFIVVFLAVGLSGKTRKNVLIVSLALSVSSVVLFYIVQMITMLMAKFQAVPPLFGAWFPVVLFIAVSSFLFRFAKT